MFRLIVFVLMGYFAYRGLKAMGLFPFRSGGSGGFAASNGGETDTELLKDPQCGVYFLKQSGVRAKLDNRILYFCSRDCLDAYMRSHSSDRNAPPFHEES